MAKPTWTKTLNEVLKQPTVQVVLTSKTTGNEYTTDVVRQLPVVSTGVVDEVEGGFKYSIVDTKNNLEEKDGEILSNPRTYRVIKPGVEFEGTVRFYNQLEESKGIETTIKEELEEVLKEFNNGLYGIGNSKSRGYGQVKVEIIDYDKKG